MGQYQQWLYHREVDQQLRAQLELRSQELRRLQEQAAQLEAEVSFDGNSILQAVAVRAASQLAAEHLAVSQNGFAVSTDNEQPGVSSALFAWSHLPNLDTRTISTTSSPPNTPERSTPQHPDATLLPEDMTTFIDTHTRTLPRLHVPRLQPQAEEEMPQEDGPEDRMEHSIQRWLERWGKQTATIPHANTEQRDSEEDTSE